MRQRVMIAMALASNPALLIADEPTTALDVTTQANVIDLLVRLSEERELAVLLITHDLGIVAGFSQDVLVMYAGAPVEYGPPGACSRRPGHPYTQALMAAVPRLTDERGTELASIPGSLPPRRRDPAAAAASKRAAGSAAGASSAAASGRAFDLRDRDGSSPATSSRRHGRPRHEVKDRGRARTAGRPRGRRGARADRRPREELPRTRCARLRPALPARGRRRLLRHQPGRVARPRRRVRLGQVDGCPAAARADGSHARGGRFEGRPLEVEPARRPREGAPRPRSDGLPGSRRLARSDDDGRLGSSPSRSTCCAERRAGAPPAASRSCSSSSASRPPSAGAGRSSSPAGSGSASRSRARSPPTPALDRLRRGGLLARRLGARPDPEPAARPPEPARARLPLHLARPLDRAPCLRPRRGHVRRPVRRGRRRPTRSSARRSTRTRSRSSPPSRCPTRRSSAAGAASGLSGELPDLTAPITGCIFASRCWKAEERCNVEAPPLEERAPGHRSACHFPENVRLTTAQLERRAAMSTTVTEYPGYEAICPWHHRQPFDGVEQYPTGDHARGRALPVLGARARQQHAVVDLRGTKRVNCGTFYVQPGGWFDPGNHPEPGALLHPQGHAPPLATRDTSDVIEIRAGEASNIPALAYHHAWNFGDEVCEILWWVPGEMHTEEFKAKLDRDAVESAVVRAHARDAERRQRPQRRLPVAPRRPGALAARREHEGDARHAAPAALDLAAPPPGHRSAADRAQLVLLLRRADPLQPGRPCRAGASRSRSRATTSGCSTSSPARSRST